MKLNDEKILAALISCGSVRKAAERSGVSVYAITKRLNTDDFRAKYEALKNNILTEACDSLTARLTLAIDTLDTATQQYIEQYAIDRHITYIKPITAKSKYEAANRLFNSAEWIIDNAATDTNARAQLEQFCTDSGFNAFAAEAAKVINAE